MTQKLASHFEPGCLTEALPDVMHDLGAGAGAGAGAGSWGGKRNRVKTLSDSGGLESLRISKHF